MPYLVISDGDYYISEYSRVSNAALNASKTEIILLVPNPAHLLAHDQYAIWACGWRQVDTRQHQAALHQYG
ncbi:hypothetical protein L0F63_004856 [Massospora cicadina]|nr:hypothetical protein L0F63_004856 [Massospora cicadina]